MKPNWVLLLNLEAFCIKISDVLPVLSLHKLSNNAWLVLLLFHYRTCLLWPNKYH